WHLSFQDLIPTDQFPSIRLQDTSYPLYCVALQGIYAVQSCFFHPCLALGACFPRRLIHLISTDMDVFGRENSSHFIQYIREESKCFFIANAKFGMLMGRTRTR